jgi:molecular chaperone GrpE
MGTNRSSRDPRQDRELETAPEAKPDEKARITELEAELSEVKDRLLRALAEQENVRRRTERERAEAVKFAASNVVRDLLPAIDNLRRAIESVPEGKALDEPMQKLLTGVEATEQGLLEALEKHGIRRIDPLGAMFDPTQHQAMLEVTDSTRPAGTVAEVLQPGYLHHDRLLRPAMVAVAKNDDSSRATQASDT